MRTLISVIITSLVLMSCSIARLPMVKGIDDVKVNRFNKDSLYLDVGLKINNPGTWGYRIKRVDVNLMMNDKPVGSINGKLPFKLITKGDRTYNITAGVGTNNVVNVIPDLLGIFSGKQVKLQLQGQIKMRWFIFTKTIKFDNNKEFKMPKLFGKN